MQEYTYADFCNSLHDEEKHIAAAIHDHITSRCLEYKPFDIRPTNSTGQVWNVNFRKKPKVGKALCTLYSIDGKLAIRVVSAGFLGYELLLRQNEFDDKVRHYFLRGFCKNCDINCYYQYREYHYANHELLASSKMGCPYNQTPAEYAGITGDYDMINHVNKDDLKDILYLIDLQYKHITRPRNPKDIRGGNYAEMSKHRCGDVDIITLQQVELDIDDFEISDYCDAKRLDKYAMEYSLTPMGVDNGLWLYHDAKAVCGEADNEYNHTVIPQGRYASVTIRDPFSFSAWRIWTYIAEWMRENHINIRPVDFDSTGVPYFTKLYRKDSGDCMTVFVPIL